MPADQATRQRDRRGVAAGGLRLGVLAAAVSVVVAVAVLAAVLLFGGALRPAVPGLGDSGRLTAWGMPLARLAMNAAAALTVGWLVLAAMCVPGDDDGALAAPGLACLRMAASGAAVWALAAMVTAVFQVSEVLGVPVGQIGSAGTLLGLLIDVPQGRALLFVAVVAAVLPIVSGLVRTASGAQFPVMIAFVGLLPPLFTGHAGTGHDLAIFSLIVHVTAVSTWVGGLAALVASHRRLIAVLPQTVSSFSTLAGWCWLAVAATGLINALITMEGIAALTTSRYGVLVLTKIAALGGLGALGWWHRRASIPALTDQPTDQRGTRTFGRVAAVEVVVMAATLALAVGLAQASPP